MKRPILVFAFVCLSRVAFTQTSDLDTSKWILQDATVTEFLGKKCLMGSAFLKEVTFSDGVIEADLAVTGQRSYPGLVFRKQNDTAYERVYIRPHLPKSFSNVVQYVACFNGIDSWQLYNGNGYTAAAEIPVNAWFHVRLEVKIRRHAFTLITQQNRLCLSVIWRTVQARATLASWDPKTVPLIFAI